MNRSIVFRIIAGLVLLAVLAGIAFFAYQAGVSQGMVSELPSGSGLPENVPQSGYWPSWHYGRGGLFFAPFFLLRCLVGLFLFFLAVSAFRFLLWGPRWRMHHWGHPGMWGRGPWGHGPWSDWKPGEGPQSMFDVWHRKAHEGMPAPESGEGQK